MADLAKEFVTTLVAIFSSVWAVYQAFSLRKIQKIKLHAEVLRLLDPGSEEHRLIYQQVQTWIRQGYEPLVVQKRRKYQAMLLYGAIVVAEIVLLPVVYPTWLRVVYWVGLPINVAAFVTYAFDFQSLQKQMHSTALAKEAASMEAPPPPEPSSPQ